MYCGGGNSPFGEKRTVRFGGVATNDTHCSGAVGEGLEF